MSYGNEENFFHKLEKLRFQLKVLTFLKPNFSKNKFISFFFFHGENLNLHDIENLLQASQQEKTAAVFQGTQIRYASELPEVPSAGR